MSEILEAVKAGDFFQIERLVQAGDVNAKNFTGDTILHFAVELKSGVLEMVEFLIEHGADVNCKNNWNDSVLHYAAWYGSLEIVKYLVKNGADVNCKNKENESVLHYAAESGSLKTVKYLVEHGADVNSKNKENESVLHYAAESGSLKIVKYLVQDGADVNSRDKGNWSVLYHAAESGSLEIIKYLVERGADVNCKTKEDELALHNAANSGSLEIVKYFVVNNPQATMEEHPGKQTVLFVAVKQGNEAVVDYLLFHGAIKNIYDLGHIGRCSLLKIACYDGNSTLVQTLLKYKVDIQKEKELVCGNEEIANFLNLELKKSMKHQEKIENLKLLDDKKLKKVFNIH